MISEVSRAFTQGSFLPNAVVFGGGENLGFIIGLAGREHVINDAREFVRERGDGGRGAQLCPEAPEDVAQRRVAKATRDW